MPHQKQPAAERRNEDMDRPDREGRGGGRSGGGEGRPGRGEGRERGRGRERGGSGEGAEGQWTEDDFKQRVRERLERIEERLDRIEGRRGEGRGGGSR